MNDRHRNLRTLVLAVGLALLLALCPLLPGQTGLARVTGEETSGASSQALRDARLVEALVAEGKGTVTQHYGFSPARGWQGHVLIAAEEGREILAPKAGTVAFVGEIGPESGYARAPLGYGLILRHDEGLVSLYTHCEQVFVEEGQQVDTGSALASVKKPEAEKLGPYFLFRLQDEDNAPLPPERLFEACARSGQ